MSVDDDFDFKLWLLDTHISESGLKKLLTNQVIDRESLEVLSKDDILQMKLAVADRAKFVEGL